MNTPTNRAAGQIAPDPIFLPVGDTALSVQFGDGIDPDTNRRVIALAQDITATPVDGVVEIVPTYRSLLVSYDPAVVRGRSLQQVLYERLQKVECDGPTGRLWHVPVVYGGAVGMDLETLADEKGMTVEDLIALHSSVEYRVYMIGFAPGFAYLGGLPQRLHTARLPTPRLSIPAGAIGIGGQQGSISSVAGPSGWRFVGWTPWRAFDAGRDDPFLFAAGDHVRFVPVDMAQGERIARQVAAGQLRISPEVQP